MARAGAALGADAPALCARAGRLDEGAARGHRAEDRARPRARARAGRRAPRAAPRARHRHARGRREDPRVRGGVRRPATLAAGAVRGQRHVRAARLHGARADPRSGARASGGRVRAGRRAVRDAHRGAPVRRAEGGAGGRKSRVEPRVDAARVETAHRSRPARRANATTTGGPRAGPSRTAIRNAPPQPLRGLVPDVSRGLERVVLRCLEKEPSSATTTAAPSRTPWPRSSRSAVIPQPRALIASALAAAKLGGDELPPAQALFRAPRRRAAQRAVARARRGPARRHLRAGRRGRRAHRAQPPPARRRGAAQRRGPAARRALRGARLPARSSPGRGRRSSSMGSSST